MAPAFSTLYTPASTPATIRFYNGTTDGAAPTLDKGMGKSNLRPALPKEVNAIDIRSLDPPASLTQDGYEVARSTTQLREHDFASGPAAIKEKVEDAYYKECENLVMKRTGAVDAVAYHHRHRQQKHVDPNEIKGFSEKPVMQWHLDNDAETAMTTLNEVLGEERAAEWNRSHWAIINVWRPLGDVVRQMPLGICDIRHLKMKETAVPIATTGNYKKHILGLRNRPDYQIFYCSNQAPDEALMFVNHDSLADSDITGMGHGALEDHNTPPDAPLRRSVEVRVLCRFPN